MVGQTIQTSTWAHNCGMHVIADYLIEQIQKQDFELIFAGAAYDELLTCFRKEYQQDNLTWSQIREASTKASSINSQIIWGIPLRTLLHNIIEKNIAYKANLAEQYLPLLNFIINKDFSEIQTTYPILYAANKDYFTNTKEIKSRRANVTLGSRLDKNSQQQFNRYGFKNYCEAILQQNTDTNLFHWLGTSELTVICDFFNINPIIHGYEASSKKNTNKIFFTNQGEEHWEREILASQTPNVRRNKPIDTFFSQHYIDEGYQHFVKHRPEIGQIFFSEKYEHEALWPINIAKVQDSPLYKIIENKENTAYLEYIKNNKFSNSELLGHINYAVTYFTSNNFIEWFKAIKESDSIFKQYDKVLLSAVKQHQQAIISKLLALYPNEFTAKACMPALLYAAKQDYADIAHKILAMPSFNQSGHINQALSYVTPAFIHTLNQADKHDVRALYYAIANRNASLVKNLLDKGACSTYVTRNKNGLQWALETENSEMILLLSRNLYKEDLSLNYNAKGDNAFHVCSNNRDIINLHKLNEFCYWNKDNLVLERLIFSRALNSKNTAGMNCLLIAAAIGHIEGIEYCLKNNVKLTSKAYNGNTALHLAVLNNQLDTVKYLEQKIQEYNKSIYLTYNKVNLNQPNKDNKSPLDLAYENNYGEIISYFRELGCVSLIREAGQTHY